MSCFDTGSARTQVEALEADLDRLRADVERLTERLDDSEAELVDLRDELADARAPNVAKGREAEELRAAIEALIAGDWGDGSECEAFDMEEWGQKRLQKILDEVDARDSLDYVETYVAARRVLSCIVSNAELMSDPRMDGAADCFGVPLDDVISAETLLKSMKG